MTPHRPTWVGRAAALVLLGLALLALKALVVDPVLDAYAARMAEIARLDALSARYRAFAERLPELRAERERLVRETRASQGFLAAPNETLAAADLQARLKTLVDSVHGELKSTQVLPVQQIGGFRRVGVRGEMSMTLPAIQRVLYAAEAGSPTLVLDGLSIRTKAADRQVERNPDRVLLDFSVDLYGFLRSAP